MFFNITKEKLNDLKAIHTATEIAQQPRTWLKTLHQIKANADEIQLFLYDTLNADDYDIILTGAGTSEFVGNSLFAYLNTLINHKVKSYATTDIVSSPENYLSATKTTLLISFGRSGNSPESIGAVELAEIVSNNLRHLFISCNPEGQLSTKAKMLTNAYALNLTPETHDQGFAMTSSFSNMYLAALLIFNLDKLDEIERYITSITTTTTKFIERDYAPLIDFVSNYNYKRIVYLGSSTLKGIAQESALKMLELTAGQVTTMFDTPLGFRHGPKSIINDETLTIIYLSDNDYTAQYEIDLIKEMNAQRKNNKIVAISSRNYKEVASLVDYYYCFENSMKLDNVYLGLNYIVVAQLISLFKSLSLNIGTDNPCPSGEVNRVVSGVTLYPYTKEA